jgi:hypothetical protein
MWLRKQGEKIGYLSDLLQVKLATWLNRFSAKAI